MDIFWFLPFVASLALGTVNAGTKQEHLASQTTKPSFIDSSIFGRRLGADTITSPSEPLLPSYYVRDFDEDVEYSGSDTFMHLPFTNCFSPEANETFDIAIVGAPFDLG